MVTQPESSQRLLRPPIEEVVCGFIFESLPIDALDFGVYWHERVEDFPHKTLLNAFLEREALLQLDVPLMRAKLASRSRDFIIQIQSDRFYMNWRRAEGEYPRFSDQGDDVGLKTKAVKEFGRFAGFCNEHIRQKPNLIRLELIKVDILRQGTHYSDADDLGNMLKVARVFEDIQASPATQLHLRLDEERREGSVQVAITAGIDITRIETRTLFVPGDDLDRSFHAANQRLNEVFFGLLDRDSLARFNQEVMQ